MHATPSINRHTSDESMLPSSTEYKPLDHNSLPTNDILLSPSTRTHQQLEWTTQTLVRSLSILILPALSSAAFFAWPMTRSRTVGETTDMNGDVTQLHGLTKEINGDTTQEKEYLDFYVYVFYFHTLYYALSFLLNYAQFQLAFPRGFSSFFAKAIVFLAGLVTNQIIMVSIGPTLLSENPFVTTISGAIIYIFTAIYFGYLAYGPPEKLTKVMEGHVCHVQTYMLNRAVPTTTEVAAATWDFMSESCARFRRQYHHVLGIVALSFVVYFFCQNTLIIFASVKTETEKFFVSLLFQIGFFFARWIIRFLGGRYDRTLTQASLRQCLVFMVHMFFYIFYRALFDSVDNTQTFILIQIQSMVFEVATYYLLALPFYYEFQQRVESYILGPPSQRRRPPEDYPTYLASTCIEYTLRVTGFFNGILNLLLLELIIRNVSYSEIFRSMSLTNDEGDRPLQYVYWSILFETLVVIVLEIIYRRRFNVSILGQWKLFIDGWNNYIYLLYAACHINTDMVLARTRVDFG